jgi:hypothetical protein
MKVEVALLDSGSATFDVDSRDTGADLLDKVSQHLNLTEKDYFGFLVLDKHDKIWTWLHNERKVTKQVRPEEARLLFQVCSLVETMSIPLVVKLDSMLVQHGIFPGQVLPAGARSASRGLDPLPNVPANPK